MTSAPVTGILRKAAVFSPTGCYILCKATEFTSGPKSKRAYNTANDFGWHPVHYPGTCECRLVSNPEKEEENGQILCFHVLKLLVSGRCDVPGWLETFGELSMGLPVSPELDFGWDEEKKCWVKTLQESVEECRAELRKIIDREEQQNDEAESAQKEKVVEPETNETTATPQEKGEKRMREGDDSSWYWDLGAINVLHGIDR
ncbi:hypothetical protein F5Y18DRAFT_428386 [Xylariaceae sp. FL1019]|nr:hypothetical protein F5Y18DRAFT_428386 [Xylariaceae sp. FL1019]